MVCNRVQELGLQPWIPLCLPERECVHEVRNTGRARLDCRAPLLSHFAVQENGMEEVMAGSREPRRCDQRTGLERRTVIGETVDDVFHEFLR